MQLLTMAIMAVGVMVSTLGGFVRHSGPDRLFETFAWLPNAPWLFDHPEFMFLTGVGLVVVGLICQPKRVF